MHQLLRPGNPRRARTKTWQRVTAAGTAGVLLAGGLLTTAGSAVAAPVEPAYEPTVVGTAEDPAAPAELVHTWTFETAADLATVDANGGVELSRVPNLDGDGYVLQVARGADDWRAPVFGAGFTEAGALYELRTDARVSADAPDARLEFRSMGGFGYAGGADVAADAWTPIVSGEFRAGGTVDAIMVQLGGGGAAAGSTYYLDNVELWRLEAAPQVDEDFEFEDLFFDFEDGAPGGWFARDASGQGPTLEVVSPGADGSGHALRVDGRGTQGDGPMLDVVDLLAPMTRLQFEADIRFVDHADGSGAITLSSQTGASTFTNLVQNMQVGNDWTRVGGEFMMPAFTTVANLYLETPWQSGAAGDTTAFEVDNIRIVEPAPLEWQRYLPGLQETLDIDAVGVAVDSRELSGSHAELVTHHFNHIVGENHMKPESWFAGSSMDTFRRHPEATAMLDFAVANDLTLFGHVLVWHSQTPSWFFQQDGRDLQNNPADRAFMEARTVEFFRLIAEDITRDYGLFGTDGNPMNSWEVVNEVVAGNPAVASGMREASPWFRIFGRDFVDMAFRHADAIFNGEFHVDSQDADAPVPHGHPNRITLWINDYNTERGLGVLNENTKRWVLFELVNELLENDAPIDGVGHQFHAGLEWPVSGLADALNLFAFDNGHIHQSRPLLQAITEVDVTIPGGEATERNLLRQGHYYREAFDIIRAHQAAHGDIDNVTIWGLTDGRSWRAAQAPLLFNDDLTAKPAFFGSIYGGLTPELIAAAEEAAGRPIEWALPVLVEAADVFGADVPFDAATFAAPYWTHLNPQALGTADRGFTTRWTPEHLTVLAEIGPSTHATVPSRLRITYGELELVVLRDGSVVTDGDHGIEALVDGDRFLVRIPHDVAEDDHASLRVASIHGSEQSPLEHGYWNGVVTFREDLSVVEIARTETAPLLDGVLDDVWATAPAITTGNRLSGTDEHATADVRTLWYDGEEFDRIYLFAEITDEVVDTSNPDAAAPHTRDSIEFFLSLLNSRDTSYVGLYDAQFRISADGELTFSSANAAIHAQRLNAEVALTDTGWVVEASIDLRTDTGHLQGQWNTAFGGEGAVFGFDVQVNDARGGDRVSHASWADPTGLGWQSTYRWGVARLVDTLETEPEVPSYDAWDASRVYLAGDRVVVDGRVFEAQWWTQGQSPDTSGPWGSWMELGAVVTVLDGEPVRAWTDSWVFDDGDVVAHDGDVWRARWWTRNQAPGDPHGPWVRL
ncbi:Endo-1,4-beta-xylanase [Xylanimonas cellulosilytica DSM 15894]|uniref:Beta-xylanase n=1 Tax=Xylanimonas cellulosilytica (strain DSM 15894 / JCM 12276 / CECT 5975 / KCTC 9989 / LMG 20990 / NBRC 107835 / XIL07) TaxID=446471 RepID=D1BXQ7_XYLCX|nr:endo-1,4-beta-xylanase [Xylanimonas cellulosilytica]ACZ31698.1 Endo-1,4-beta-xylanase [Xylanimonas cellulosilytica DSM 15894]